MARKRKKDPLGKRGSAKIGRNLKKCQKYRLEGRRERNQERRAKRIQSGFRRT